MTELLGSKFCIDSLSRDANELQGVLSGFSSRLGPVSAQSWKFPDKLASDVNVLELIEMYEYDEDYQEENKIAHVMLLELIIDRLIYFIQSSSQYTDHMISAERVSSASNETKTSSIGLVCKKYLNKVLQLHSQTTQTQSELVTQKRKIIEIQDFNKQLQDELSKYHTGVVSVSTSAVSKQKIVGGSLLPPVSPRQIAPGIAKDSSSKSSQTHETAFVPCESCHRVQGSLKAVADAMVNLSKSQGLPSSLAKYRKQLQGLDWYTANDLARWSVEQNKDLDKINKHLEELMATIEPLKAELTSSLSTCRNLEQRVSQCEHDIALEKETQTTQLKQHMAKMESLKREHADLLAILEEQKKSLEESKVNLEKRLKDAKRELELQKSKYAELDDVKQQLIADLELSRTHHAEVKRLETVLVQLEKELQQTQQNLLEAEAKLSQEQAIKLNISSRTESLQNKYDSLLRRIDEMDNENLALQTELSSLTEERERMETELNEARKDSRNSDAQPDVIAAVEKERHALKSQITELQTTVSSLENSLQQMKERERLMVEYPDLNGPVNPDVTGSGDIATDMANQVLANEMRIELLQQQNASLRKTIDKLKMKTQNLQSLPSKHSLGGNDNSHNSHQFRNSSNASLPAPQQLWQRVDSQLYDEKSNSENKAENAAAHRKRGTSGTDSLHRPGADTVRSAQAGVASSSSGVNAYIKLKRAGLIKTPAAAAATQAPPATSLSCTYCDKLYHSAADLELHRAYCTKR